MPVVLITGAKGQLGCELKQISGKYFGYDLIFTDVDTLDITDNGKTRDFILTCRPDWIINCAAYNYVDRAEEEPDAAFRINANGVMNIVNTIKDSGCHLIHFSSDYIFDGLSSLPYTETDPANPLSKYGASKLEGEKQALKHPWTMIIRTSWLYSEYGNNFVKTIIRKAKENETLRVVNDQKGSPTWAADLAGVVMKIISDVNRKEAAFNNGIYHYSNEGSCTWYEFAVKILETAGVECQVSPVSTLEYGAKAARPHFSLLSKKKIMENYGIIIPTWDKSLEQCISQMKRKNNLINSSCYL